MYISQRSVYQNSNLTSIVPLYSRKRHQEDQTKDKYRGHHCLFKFVTSETKEVKSRKRTNALLVGTSISIGVVSVSVLYDQKALESCQNFDISNVGY